MHPRSLSLCAALALALVAAAGEAHGLTIFSESFDGYTHFPDEVPANDAVNLGRPLASEGAGANWLAARFGTPETECAGVALECDLAIQKRGGSGNRTPTGRFEDQAGLLFAIDTTALADLVLHFDWRTFAAPLGDQSVVGYFLGASPFGPDGVHVDASLFTELLRVDVHSSFTHHTFSLPGGVGTLWVGFWHDGGENDYTKLDNVTVTAEASSVPEPSALLLLLGSGLLGLGSFGRRWRN